MRVLLAILCAVLTTGCGTIYTIEPESGPYAYMPTPVLSEASLDGPIVEKVRIAGWNTFNYGAVVVAAGGSYAGASASGTAVAFEHYKSADVQEFLQKLLEDTGTVTRIFPGARWEIRGTGGQSTLACAGCAVYTNLMTFTLAAFAGIPIYGIREASVELRLYRDHEFIQAYNGHGKCGAFGTIYWALWNGITYRNRGGPFGSCSVAAAVADAVRQIQESPPRLEDEKRHRAPAEPSPEPTTTQL
jgi:hypothetical protein